MKTTPHRLAGAPVAITLRSVVWVVVDGPQKGARFRTEGDRVVIGSGPTAHIVLTDTTVSRQHAEIIAAREQLLVRDLESTNGTFLNGAQVKEAYLAPGARLRLGATTLTFELKAEDLLVEPTEDDHFGDLIGRSLAMRQLFGVLRRIAASDVSVVMHGETGTGKDVAARALHAASGRANKPFVVLDCSAVDRELVSSELFGHEPGAFTGATAARAGAFEQASGGTLFIDEIGELSLELQPKLLRALENREVKRLGGSKTIRVDCRVIAATHRDLPRMVAEGRFREDLWHRMSHIVISIPPLSARREDIPLLVGRFLRSGRPRFSAAAMARLAEADIPGNVRGLKNIVDRACALATGAEVQPDDLALGTSATWAAKPAAPAPEEPASGSLQDAERAAIVKALKIARYHREKAAAALGISLPTLRKRIRQHGIHVPERGESPSE